MRRKTKIIDVVMHEETEQQFFERVEDRLEERASEKYETMHGQAAEDFDAFNLVCREDRRRARRIAKGLLDLRPPETRFPKRIQKEEKEQFLRLSRGSVELVHNVDTVDERFAALHAESPWLAKLTTRAWQDARSAAERGRPFQVGPYILLGPPGIGKSRFAHRLAEVFGLPLAHADIGATGGVFEIQGTDAGWSGSRSGRLVSTILGSRVANPMVLLDELDSGRTRTDTTKGNIPGLFDALLGLLEPETARRWTCPHYEVQFDLSRVSWLFTTNSVADLPSALLSRCTVIPLDDLKPDDIHRVLRSMRRELELDDMLLDVAERGLVETMKKRPWRRMDARTVRTVAERLRNADQKPRLH